MSFRVMLFLSLLTALGGCAVPARKGELRSLETSRAAAAWRRYWEIQAENAPIQTP